MSDYMFGVSKKKPSRAEAKMLDSIARKHDCHFIEATLPGTGYQRWFSGPNRGEPFNSRMKKDVLEEIKKVSA